MENPLEISPSNGGGSGTLKIQIDQQIPMPVWTKALFAAIILVVIWWTWKKVKAAFAPNLHVPDSEPVEFDGDVTRQWLQGEMPNLVTRLHDVLTSSYFTGGSSARCQACDAVTQLNNNQLRKLSNSYNNTFGGTIRGDLQKTWTSGCVWTNHCSRLQTKLDLLNL